MQGNTTEIKGDKTQQEEAACDTVVQVEPFFMAWVDELSQVAGTLRAGKAIKLEQTVSLPRRVVWQAKLTGASLRKL